eukprot:CAMPEP_0175969760 /NCGR_PEP_ID=MMETSP0108-20121206/40660_1 /TAXON_ID=195067 ORGANISM="Goniomonas pacifica, Strain CCMP1869" /NCGR_SAMPLE_ID=MMETSP0108 /ASSEMBLY_ACC=CAM_ASM_000204 /LENGTH=39 /DNA_ID= /DNA_START= /DNA_END= /DNA_ORIENTATION=
MNHLGLATALNMYDNVPAPPGARNEGDVRSADQRQQIAL